MIKTMNKKINDKIRDISVMAMVFKENIKDRWVTGKKETSNYNN